MSSDTIRVAIVQAESVAFDLAATVEQTVHWMREAAAQGARLVVFGETWLGTYPAWLDHCPDVALWDHGPTKDVFARYRRHCPVVPGPEIEAIRNAAAELSLVVVLGVSERVEQGAGNGTLFNSLLTFDADGTLINHHRKLVPTFTERLVWGAGEADGLRSVETAVGRVGGLVCWEHWMPLSRQALHVSGEIIHVAVWPTVHEMHQIASRHYAFEGRCFVLAAGQLMATSELPDELEVAAASKDATWVLRGGSSIVGPDGKYLREPVFDQPELVLADLDPTQAEREKMTLDVTGHYHRPDVFEFALRQRE